MDYDVEVDQLFDILCYNKILIEDFLNLYLEDNLIGKTRITYNIRKFINEKKYKSNWMIIYRNNSLKVIGGKWDGIEPAEKNIKIINLLEATKMKYLI